MGIKRRGDLIADSKSGEKKKLEKEVCIRVGLQITQIQESQSTQEILRALDAHKITGRAGRLWKESRGNLITDFFKELLTLSIAIEK